MISSVTASDSDGAVTITYDDSRPPISTNLNLPADTADRADLHRWLAAGGIVGERVIAHPAIDDYRFAIQRHIDAMVSQRGYDSGVTCASYAGSTNPTWAAEAAAFVAWRDAVWVHAYTELAKIEGGQRGQPAVAGLIDELPEIGWPSSL